MRKSHSPMRRLLQGIWQNRKARAGAILVLGFSLIALIGPWLVGDPQSFDAVPLSPPSLSHWFGTTGQGQDVLAQTVCGSRQTLFVAFVTGIGVVLLGALIGGIGGFFGGWIDDAISVLINIFLVMPGLPLMVILAAWLPPGPTTMIGVLIATGWAWNARVLRSKVLSLRKMDFVDAAIVSGEPALSVLFREILPNMLSLLMTSLIGATVYAIGAQVGLEFIGLGDPSSVTWGTNLYWARNDSALLMGAWWTFIPAGLAIALVGFGLTLLNFGIDEVTNPRLRSEREWRKVVGAHIGDGPETVVLPNG
jgi:peptide/nickel transport system permease protein